MASEGGQVEGTLRGENMSYAKENCGTESTNRTRRRLEIRHSLPLTLSLKLMWTNGLHLNRIVPMSAQLLEFRTSCYFTCFWGV